MTPFRILLCVVACSCWLAAETQTDVSSRFSKMSGNFVHETLALSPSNASQAGYHKYLDAKTGKSIELDAVLDDISPEGMAKVRAVYSRWHEKFGREIKVDALNAEDAADWHLIDDQINLTLLEFDRIQNYRHNPTFSVELLGGALFQPLTDDYAPQEIRVGHVLSRISQIPHFIDEAKLDLQDADPLYIKVAVEENDGNVDLIQGMVAGLASANPSLKAEFDRVAPPALASLKAFSLWMQNDLSKRKTDRTWRLGKEFYDAKFRLIMESPATPEEVLGDAETQFKATRAEMLEVAVPLHKQMFAEHGDHSDLSGRERENKIIGEVLGKIADDHTTRDGLMSTIEADLTTTRQFVIDKKIVSLKSRDNLKVIATPVFLRGIYSVAGFHSAPPLDPNAEAEFWVTPIGADVPEAKAESKLREYNNWVLKWLTIHEALPGHYVQAEHANEIQPPTRRLVRNLFANGAYVEGWAEYVAQVMLQQGFADNDPRYRLSYLKVWLRAICNSILDVRMHTMNMTDAEAMELMTKDAFQTQAEAEGKLQRAKLSSTQLPTYFVGTREWWKLRKEYEAAKGKDFSLMEFHDRALDEGELPVSALDKLLLSAH